MAPRSVALRAAGLFASMLLTLRVLGAIDSLAASASAQAGVALAKATATMAPRG